MKALIKSFMYAGRGIWFCIRHERNFRIHIVASIYVLWFGFWFSLGRAEWAILLLTLVRSDLLGRWHYIRWQTGRPELYDLAADPWEVHDVAQLPPYATVRHALEMRRGELLAEGVVRTPTPSPGPSGHPPG